MCLKGRCYVEWERVVLAISAGSFGRHVCMLCRMRLIAARCHKRKKREERTRGSMLGSSFDVARGLTGTSRYFISRSNQDPDTVHNDIGTIYQLSHIAHGSKNVLCAVCCDRDQTTFLKPFPVRATVIEPPTDFPCHSHLFPTLRRFHTQG